MVLDRFTTAYTLRRMQCFILVAPCQAFRITNNYFLILDENANLHLVKLQGNWLVSCFMQLTGVLQSAWLSYPSETLLNSDMLWLKKKNRKLIIDGVVIKIFKMVDSRQKLILKFANWNLLCWKGYTQWTGCVVLFHRWEYCFLRVSEVVIKFIKENYVSIARRTSLTGYILKRLSQDPLV